SMPGSVSIMTGCERREAGGVASVTGYRLGGADLVCNSRAQRLNLFRAPEPEDSLDDAAVAVEQHRVRQPAVMVDLLHPSAADENRERRPKLAHEAEHLAEVDVVRDRGDGEVAAGELLIQLRHVGE